MNKEYASNFFEYLNKLYEFNKLNNSDFEITTNMIYTILINYGVIEKEDIEPLFNIWIERFKKRPGINVIRTSDFWYFCQFVNPGFNGKYAIKIYVPLKRHNLDENVTRIFDFIRSNNIMHYSKVAKVIRNDNVVIRVSNQKDADRIIDFINSDENIRKNLNPVSPLTFNYKGVGITRDGDLSYNMELCKVIASCLNKGMKLDVNNFSNYLKQKCSNEKEIDRKMVYEIGSRVFKDLSFDDICNMKNEPLKNKNALFEAMRVTKEKYGIDQVKVALYEYICNSNPNCFTRGNDRNRDYRSELCSSLDPNDVYEIVSNKVGFAKNLKEAIEKFVNITYTDEISHLKENENINVDSYLNNLRLEYIGGNHDLVSLIRTQRLKNDSFINNIQNEIVKQIYPYCSKEEINALFINGSAFNVIENIVKMQVSEKLEGNLSETMEYYLQYFEKMFQLMDYNNFVLFVSNQMLSTEKINGLERKKVFQALLEYLGKGNYVQSEKSDDILLFAQLIKERVENNQKLGR